MRYEGGVAVPDVSYPYADAVREGICRPVTFIPYDGVLQWRSGDDVVEASFEDALAGREAGRRYRTAISVGLPDGLPRILAAADERLRSLRSGEHRDAGGLVVAADSTHARAIAGLLRAHTGRAPTVVLHTEARAAEKLAAFTASSERWIVAVNMVSEGVDIPRLRVGVYATAAKTPLIFRQIVGRFVRTIPGRPVDMSWLYLPADPVLRGHAAEVERELRHVLTPTARRRPQRARRAPARARDRARRGARVRARGRRRRAPARAVRGAGAGPRPAWPRPSLRPRRPRRRRRAGRDARVRAPRRCCATSAIGWSPTCAAATAAATRRSTAG